MKFNFLLFGLLILFISCTTENDKNEKPDPFNFLTVNVDGVSDDFRYNQVSLNPVINLEFSSAISENSLNENITLINYKGSVPLQIDLINDNKTAVISPINNLDYLSKYTLAISDNLISAQQQTLSSSINITLYTQIDSTYKYPEISDEELLTKVQQQTFKYFWDFGHPVSGLARERNTSGEIVTSGGSGFGLMAILVGIERGFVTRNEGVQRLDTIFNFLANKADRFHGTWPHWLNGTTGQTIAFSTKDNGGDLVETSYLAAGLLAVKQYLNPENTFENELRQKIEQLWQDIEWDWYTKNGENVLYWHWSPDYQWEMNMPIKGYNEALITYILAASSPTHSIIADVYHAGWANYGGITNGRKFYDITLPLGCDYGGPLFFAHYSFLGINPNGLSDAYANYWQQNVNHSLINHAYCVANPKNYQAYGKDCWGLTASDNHKGYSAHSPTNDLGVITPTAALSSFPYTPDESMEALHFFYYILGDRLWGSYGFYDAFTPSQDWWGKSYLAIDQGPIIVMIENYRSGLIWNLLMQNTDVQNGLDKLGFSYKK